MQGREKELLTTAAALMADVLARDGHLRLRAFGSSMIPAIRPGDVLRVEPCTPEAACPGDVLLTRQGERVLAHRLIRKQHHGREVVLVTRGDALWQTDPSQPASMLLGRVTGISATTPFRRLYGLALTEVTRVSRGVRVWLASRAAAALRTTIGSMTSSG